MAKYWQFYVKSRILPKKGKKKKLIGNYFGKSDFLQLGEN